MDNDVAVSVICNAFNHGKYIRDTLNGFVMQKTDFKFEVLVHDDASKDDTADIIREFEAEYPDIIKPIYQTENQYSKNVWITDVYQLRRSKGKYIAICEGDDYWTDLDKLQKQYDALEAHPEIDICVHASTLVNASDGSVSGTVEHGSEVAVIPVEKVIEGGGDFVSTNSIFVRREILTDRRKFVDVCPLDYTYQISGSIRGGMLYLPDNMSAYRVSVPGSWSVSNNKNRRGNLAFVKELMAGLKQLDTDTDKKYHGIISKKRFRLFLSKVHLRLLILFKR
ncbi:MAG: glycosyltransferase family 2 protein [Clostridiales bacterium]|nr:glycosyltransferase family 2 protein [Clostridiales bacterium]